MGKNRVKVRSLEEGRSLFQKPEGVPCSWNKVGSGGARTEWRERNGVGGALRAAMRTCTSCTQASAGHPGEEEAFWGHRWGVRWRRVGRKQGKISVQETNVSVLVSLLGIDRGRD